MEAFSSDLVDWLVTTSWRKNFIGLKRMSEVRETGPESKSSDLEPVEDFYNGNSVIDSVQVPR